MKYKLKRFLRITDIKKMEDKTFNISLGYFSKDGFELTGEESLLYLLSLLNGKNDLEAVIKNVVNKYSNISENDVKNVIQYLYNEGVIETENNCIDELTKEDIARYDRHLLFYSMFLKDNFSAQKKLKKSRIVLLGMGGIGCWVTYALAGAGIGEIIGVDHDIIENSNLTRQILYSESDIGKYKVDVAAERIKKYNSLINFIPVNKEIKSVQDVQDVIKQADFVILSADKPKEIHKWVDIACTKYGVPYSNVGYINYVGACGPMVIPNNNSKYCNDVKEELNCLPEYNYPYVKEVNSIYQAPSFGPINGLISCYQVLEVIKYITKFAVPKTINKRFMIDVSTMETYYEDF